MNIKSNQSYNDDSINIIEILSSLWKKKNYIYKSTILFGIIGILYSITLDNIYTASSIFYPHFEKNNISKEQGLRNLAGLAGIDIGTESSENIPPTLYPNIISSPQFKIKILDEKINILENKITYREYLMSTKSTFDLKKILKYPISIISEMFSNSDIDNNNDNIKILKLTKEEYQLHKYLEEVIFLELNDEEGFIKLSVKDQNALIASQIANTANQILQKNIIDFKIKNIENTYEFVSSQLESAKNNFYLYQDSLAKFSDRNINIKSDLFLNQYSRIESEYLIMQNVYNELALNKEKTAIELKKNTPIFTIIKPVVIPNEKSEPTRSLIVFLFLITGFVLVSFYILMKDRLVNIWIQINK